MKYDIVFSKRRTVSLSIKNGELTVRAPYGTSDKRIAEILLKHEKWIKNNLEKSLRKEEKFAHLSEEEIKNMKKEAKKYFDFKTKEFSEIMGLKYGRITITSAQKRFGSCSSEGNICFSYRLMLYPEVAREYVIVHELAHLKEMNHSARFYKIVESVLPDYKLRRKMLK